jgi:RNA-directed DNA polymerase
LRKELISRTNTNGLKAIGIPTLIDRAVQYVYHLAIDPLVEIQSDRFNFGNRKNRSAKDSVAYLRVLLDKHFSPKFILEIEISKFFNKISHEFIMNNTPICHKNVLKE